MIAWNQRTQEQRALFNPGFTAVLLWHAARGHKSVQGNGLPLEEAFLVMPFVLHRTTRGSLPRSTKTSLAVWLENESLSRGRISSRAKALVSYTKEAIMFGGMNGAFTISNEKIEPEITICASVRHTLRQSSDEVRLCAKKAEFVGKWFAQTGSSMTVMALIGVRP